MEENKFNIKKTWSALNKIIGKHNDKTGLSNNFVINNTQVGDRQEVAEAFNIFFPKIALQTGLNIPKVNKSFKSFMPKSTLHDIFLAPVSQSDVLNITLKPALVMIVYRLNFSSVPISALLSLKKLERETLLCLC